MYHSTGPLNGPIICGYRDSFGNAVPVQQLLKPADSWIVATSYFKNRQIRAGDRIWFELDVYVSHAECRYTCRWLADMRDIPGVHGKRLELEITGDMAGNIVPISVSISGSKGPYRYPEGVDDNLIIHLPVALPEPELNKKHKRKLFL